MTRQMRPFVLTLTCDDRAGIVATVTSRLLDLGTNIQMPATPPTGRNMADGITRVTVRLLT
ncbi:hypothetical protein BC374_27535 [Ensifer sp. LC13]|nr:hypothetical protein BC362_28130 [Ensifer sp. LC14]OCP02644.1 hypothetical protein BBX50_27525 [Ensifer sp. LC11]OCP02978.1 hypothetical protein BC374_27535 [Ensifer sp. LC13]OCP29909.1 hypothetical protein BC364_27640 [Ensifer sp. LC499]